MSRFPTALLAALAGPTPEEELAIRTSGGQTLALQPDAGLSALSPAAKEALFGGERADDLPVVLGPQGERLDGGSGFTDQRTNQSSPLSEEELIALGAAERDPSTGRLVRAGTGNVMTAASGFDQRLVQPVLRERFQDRQKAIRAERDADAILELVETDGAPIDVAVRAVEDLRKTSGLGEAQLLEIPAYRKLTNAEGKYAQMLEARKMQEAARLGVPPEAMNEDGSDIDPKWLKSFAIREAQAEPVRQQMRTDLNLLDEDYKRQVRFIQDQASAIRKSKTSTAQVIQQVSQWEQEQTQALFKQYSKQRQDITGKLVTALTPSTPPPADSSAPPPVPQLTHPDLPEGVTVFAQYDTIQEARNANVPNGSYVIVDGLLLRKNGRGVWE